MNYFVQNYVIHVVDFGPHELDKGSQETNKDYNAKRPSLEETSTAALKGKQKRILSVFKHSTACVLCAGNARGGYQPFHVIHQWDLLVFFYNFFFLSVTLSTSIICSSPSYLPPATFCISIPNCLVCIVPIKTWGGPIIAFLLGSVPVRSFKPIKIMFEQENPKLFAHFKHFHLFMINYCKAKLCTGVTNKLRISKFPLEITFQFWLFKPLCPNHHTFSEPYPWASTCFYPTI